MSRLKNSGSFPPPRPPGSWPPGSWLAGALIGGAILTMATSAVVLGAGAAIQQATLRRRPGS
jgi:hypothetical protein